MNHAEGQHVVDIVADVGVEDQVDGWLRGCDGAVECGGKAEGKHNDETVVAHGGSPRIKTAIRSWPYHARSIAVINSGHGDSRPGNVC